MWYRFFLAVILAPLISAGSAPTAVLSQRGKAPAVGKQAKLAQEYLILDPQADAARREEILGILDLVDPLSAASAKSWRKKLTKFASKGRRELPKKGGRHYFWEEEERGLFYLDGELKKPNAIFIGLHGGGLGSGDASLSRGSYASAVDRLNWVGIFPQVLELTELGWTTSGTEEFVMQLVDAALQTWDVDPDRVFLGGHSMGGYGSWTVGAHHADRFAGLFPSAGAPTPYLDREGNVEDLVEGVIPNLRNVRMVCYQSADDPRVPPGPNRFAAKEMEAAKERWGGFDFEYWEVTGMGHDLPPGGPIAHLSKLADARRNSRPDKVVWQPNLDWKNSFYWLHWDTPVANALVVAEMDREANSIQVMTEADPTGLSVSIDERLVDYQRELTVLLNGQEVFRGKPQRRLGVMLLSAELRDPGMLFLDRIPLVPQ